MGILAWLVFGFLVGLVARAVMPGEQRMGFFKTAFLGIGGSMVGGSIATLLSHSPFMGFHTVGFIGSVIGAILLMAIGGLLQRR